MVQRFLALMLAAGSLMAGDLAGRWSGSFIISQDGETKNSTALIFLKQAGNKLTGSAGPDADKQSDLTGEVTDNKVKIEVNTPDGGKVWMTLVVDGDRMTGDAKAQMAEHEFTAKVDVKRER